jgi:hypothetical protein
MLDILTYLPAKRKATPGGWLSFNAVCCTHNGNTQDRRQRGGIKQTEQGWSYHCFNCAYTASFILGRNLSFKARRLLTWLGVPEAEIERVNLESMRHRSINGILQERRQTFDILAGINFPEFELPAFSEVCTPEHVEQWQYLRNRSAPLDYPFMVSGEENPYKGTSRPRPYVIVPFTYDNSVVGYTQRFLDDRTPRYINQTPPGYVFGTDLQHDSWTHVLVTEGIFDALTIGGLAVMHNTISDNQARLIRSLDRDVTVVPDQDAAGMELVDRAVELNWAVSMPEWPEGCKDVNDAVIKLGKLGTVLTIMQARETSKIKIEIRKKQLVKKIR